MSAGMLNGQLGQAVEPEELTTAREEAEAAAKRTGLQQLLVRAGLGRIVVERFGKDAGSVLLSVDQVVQLLDQNAGSVGVTLVGELPQPIRQKLALIVATAESPATGAA